MRMQDLSLAMKAVADVAHAGEQLFGSIDRARSRSHVGSLLLGVGLGVGVGALLFSDPARKQLLTWLTGTRVATHGGNDTTFATSTESTPETHDEPIAAPH